MLSGGIFVFSALSPIFEKGVRMAESLRDKVAIVGMGCTKFGERWDASLEDLLVEAGYEAFEDAKLEAKDIQAAWVGAVGSELTGQFLANALKFDYISITRVENACATATDAFMNACFAVAAGVYDIVMAAGVEKLKDNPYSGLAVGAGNLTSGVEPAYHHPYSSPWPPRVMHTITISPWRNSSASWPRSR
jgi:acetyl-CoA C-acetyltransferase